MVQRVSSGVEGFDKFIEGGYEKGSMVIVEGGPGTGKTIFCLHFAYAGIKNNEKVLYISFDETPEELLEDAKLFGMDFEPYLNKNFKIEYVSLLEIERFVERAIEMIQEFSPSRLVIDSISVIEHYISDKTEFRKFLSGLKRVMRKLGTTVLMTKEVGGADIFEESKIPIESVAEFVADAVIQLYYTGLGGEYDRSLRIVKMRRTNHIRNILPMKIKIGKGIIVKEAEEL